MKTQKMLVIVAISCLLLGVSSGAAMAEGCGDGVLLGERFDGTLRVSDETSCTIIGSTIGGDLRIINVDNVLLMNNRVNGLIRVDGQDREANSVANVIENTAFGGKLVVRDYVTANVIGNETLNKNEGDIRVIRNVSAFVQQNLAGRDLICRGNTAVDASYNAAQGTEDCEN
jgi:hypothetical protein